MNTLKRSIHLLLVVGLCVFCHVALAADEGKMTAAERAKAIKYLKDSQAETLAMIENLSDAQLKFKAAPEKWSVLDTAEHIMLAEKLIFSQVEKALADKPNPDWEEKTKGKTELIEKAIVNRTTKVQAPEAIVPSSKLSRAEVIKGLKEGRAKTLKFAEETQVPLKTYTAENPFFKTLNAYQWLIYVPLHNLRHNQQIAEVKADPNFPKK